jgi:hypothetical protein
VSDFAKTPPSGLTTDAESTSPRHSAYRPEAQRFRGMDALQIMPFNGLPESAPLVGASEGHGQNGLHRRQTLREVE